MVPQPAAERSHYATKRRPRNAVYCRRFTQTSFLRVIARAIGVEFANWTPGFQPRYIATYLEDRLGAVSLVVETHYIDRHFMEEVSLYYSKNLLPRVNFTTRIHAFAVPITNRSLNKLIERASQKAVRKVTLELERDYLGYVVIRPLSSVPIGRTVLNHPRETNGFRFPTCYKYPVHFLGFELSVKGLPFQQQDQAVAACATTAVWSALQRIKRREGDRAPTSWEITDAAARHAIPHGRSLPSSGLTMEQMSEALRYFGYAPDLVRRKGSARNFLTLLGIYLHSGIPVILTLFEKGETEEGHAVTVVGYKRSRKRIAPYPIPYGSQHVRVERLNLAYDGLFVHDDRLGPYFPVRFEVSEVTDAEKTKTHEDLSVYIHWQREIKTYYPRVAIVPLYPKLRTNASELFQASLGFVAYLIQSGLILDDQKLGLFMYFQRSGEYQASIYHRGLTSAKTSTFQRKIALSRYVGIHRWSIGKNQVLETLWDTTDTYRENTLYEESLLGIVCIDGRYRRAVNQLAELFDVPSL